MSNNLLDRHAMPSPRPVRRRWGCVVVLLVIVVTSWAIGKHLATGGLASSEIEQGTVMLHAAVAEGDRSAFDGAKAHFVDAASVSPFDRYPAFLIRTTDRLRADRGGEDPHDLVGDALIARDYEAARKAAARLGDVGTRPRVYWERLIDRFESLDESGV